MQARPAIPTDPVPLGPWWLDAPLGAGGMGAVWRGRHARTGMPVAIKTILQERARQPAMLEAFRREVRGAAAIDHPNVLRVLDHGVVPPEVEARTGLVAGAPYFVAPLARGSLRPHAGRVSWSRARIWLAELLDALAAAHARGVLHRDVKPENVLLGDADRVLLADFGVADLLVLDATRAQREGPRGTQGYRPPEQREGRFRDQGPWTDLYAVGRLALELVPGIGDPERMPAAAAWVATMDEAEPADRFRHAADARHALLGLPEEDADPGPVGAPARTSEDTWFEGGDRAEPVATTTAQRLPRVAPPIGGWERAAAPELPLTDTGLALLGLRPVPLIGRRRQQERLWDALREASDRREAQVVGLAGPRGAGRSALGRWLGERAAELGVAQVVAFPAGEGLGGAVLGWARARGLAVEAAQARVTALGVALGLDGPERLGQIAVGAPVDERYPTVVAWLSRLAAERPLVLWLDDPDDDARALVPWLLGPPPVGPGLAALVLVAPRDPVDLPAGAVMVSVDPLGARETHELVSALAPFEPGVAARIAERSGGNPALAAALVAAATHRSLSGRDGFVADVAALELPDLAALAQARVDRLPAEQRDVLELAATFGGDVDPVELGAVCARAGLALGAGWLEAWCAARILEVAPHGYRLDAALREGLLAGGTERRARWHRVCADHLRAQGGSPRRVAMHLMGAEALEEALEWLLEAANRSNDAGEPGLPETLLLEHLRVCDRLGLPEHDARRLAGYARRAVLLRPRGHHDEAIALCRAVVDHGEGIDVARALIELARIACIQGRAAEAAPWLERAEPLVRADPRWLGLLLHTRATGAQLLGDREGALRDAGRAVALLREAGKPTERSYAVMMFALLLQEGGHLDEAERTLRAAELELRGTQGRPWAEVCFRLARVLEERGDHTAALELFAPAAEVLLRVRSINAATACAAVARSLVMMGRHREALDQLVVARLAARRPVDELEIHVVAVEPAAALGEWERLEEHLAAWEALVALAPVEDRSSAARAAQMAADRPDLAARAARLAEGPPDGTARGPER